MSDRGIFLTGLIGTIVSAVCCFTSFGIWFFWLIGLGFIVPALDYIFVPLLVIFSFVLVYALAKHFGLTKQV